MLDISFSLNSPPFSINKAYYKNRQRTQQCREWGDNILIQLQNPDILNKLKLIKKEFQENKHTLTVSLYFYFPCTTKNGRINKRAGDLSNFEKLILDLIFDNRYNGRQISGHIIENLDIDDSFITALHSYKVPSNDKMIDVEISIN